uniref:Tenascin C n=1 Tax=Electrophorus electricus TaxID=8005 RepID=A0A4W4FV87_ELEEL
KNGKMKRLKTLIFFSFGQKGTLSIFMLASFYVACVYCLTFVQFLSLSLSSLPRDATVESQATDYAFNRQNEIVFTHRINIPKQACGCTDGHPELRELLNRLEMLEDEVSTLRERCGGHSTCCGAQVGTKPYCSGHGNYSTEICACICDKGWKGPNCTLSDCPNDCRGHCVDGDCVCYDPWTGFDCSELICPNDCYDRGLCVNGTCLCDKGFRGEDCGERVCTKNCTGHGRCVDGKCICNPGYTGEDLSPPKDLSISEITPKTVNLTWTNEMLVKEYLITYIPTSSDGLQLDVRVPGDLTTATITEIEPGIEYSIHVYAILDNKKSIPVGTRVATKVVVFLSVCFYFQKEENGKIVNTLPPSQTHFEQSGLGPGQQYEVSVSIIKNNIKGIPLSRTIVTRIDAPDEVEVRDVTDTSAMVSWSRPVAEVDKFIVSYGPAKVSSAWHDMDVHATIMQHILEGLEPDTDYQVSISSKKGDIASEPIYESFTTGLDAPRDLEAIEVTETTMVLLWKKPRANITNYRLVFVFTDGQWEELSLPADATTYTQKHLVPGKHYNITLVAEHGQRKSAPATLTASTVGLLYKNPKDCSQTLLNGETTSGLYTIYPGGYDKLPVLVYCDMTTDGGGWLVILRRQNGNLDFYRNWKNYTSGFGDVNNEFWLGLSNLHTITASSQYELRVDLRDGQESAYAQYDRLYVGEPRSRYKLQTGAYSGTAGDSLIYHQNRPFSTYDNDNDLAITNCALSYKGAFWYKNCHHVNLMGRYGDNSHSKGINWFHWKGHEHSIPFVEMKIRPVNFRNLEDR